MIGVFSTWQGSAPIQDVGLLKQLMAQLESNIKDSCKEADDVDGWRADLEEVGSSTFTF